jgi:hypothetical protein
VRQHRTLLLFSAAAAGAGELLPAESVDPLSTARSRLACAQQVSALLARSSTPSRSLLAAMYMRWKRVPQLKLLGPSLQVASSARVHRPCSALLTLC